MKKEIIFLLKVLFFATILSAAWLPVAEMYTALVARCAVIATLAVKKAVMIDILSMDNIRTGGEFSPIIPFAALILATPGIKASYRLKFLAGGIVFFFFFEVFFLVSQLIFNQVQASLIQFYLISRAALPVFLWILLAHRTVLGIGKVEEVGVVKDSARQKSYRCPFCGKRKADILKHVENVHGKSWVGKKKFVKFLDRHPELKNS